MPAFDFTIGFPSDASDFLGAHADLTRLKRELAAAKSLDAYFACEQFLASGATPGATDCTREQNATYAEVLKAHAFPGRDLIAEGKLKGMGLRKGAAEEEVQRKIADARGRVTRSWRYIVNRITGSIVPASLVVADKSSARFNELKLGALGTKLSYLVEDTGLRMRLPRDGNGVVFRRGDSGSILALQGLAPVLALQSVDNVETSGGRFRRVLARETIVGRGALEFLSCEGVSPIRARVCVSGWSTLIGTSNVKVCEIREERIRRRNRRLFSRPLPLSSHHGTTSGKRSERRCLSAP